METQVITSKLDQLPEDLKEEVLDYIEFLLQKGTYQRRAKKNKFKFDWEGGLSDLKKKYTSVSLQHKALEWR
ncbi:MAG: DUF2281 domain-containing protein [Candidatus Methanoperedens sp.]|nr:DUF2281 domain-containing protein [Candidatus Methanoperedens sp.]